MENSQPPVPPAPPTSPPPPPAQPAGGQIISANATPIVPKAERLTYNQRFLRREKVKDLLDKGVTSVSKIAKTLNVTNVTIRKDIDAINKERKGSLSREAATDHVSTMLGQMEEVIKNATMDYMQITGNDAKSNAAKASLLQTSLRAVMAKAQLLQQTGVVPSDITMVDKLLEAQAIEIKAKQTFDPQLAQVVASAESRRKVMDLVDKMKGISPDTASAILEKLDRKIAEDEVRAPQAATPSPTGPQAEVQTPSTSPAQPPTTQE